MTTIEQETDAEQEGRISTPIEGDKRENVHSYAISRVLLPMECPQQKHQRLVQKPCMPIESGGCLALLR
jgi:hypothetical protein